MRTSPGSQNEPRPVDEGMTLPELLVAMGLFSLLTLLICTTSILGYRIATNLENRTDNATQNQVAVDAISKVLRTAILPDQMADSSCVSCADTAIIQATGTRSPSTPTWVTRSDPTTSSSRWSRTRTPRRPAGCSGRSWCPRSSPGPGSTSSAIRQRLAATTRPARLARGLTWPATQLFAYYNFDGNQITSSAFSTADLASVASVEVSLTVQTIKGQSRFPATTEVRRIRLPNSDINVLVQPTT